MSMQRADDILEDDGSMPPLTPADEQRILEQASLKVWERTYRFDESDSAAWQHVQTHLGEPQDANDFKFTTKILWGAKWLHCGHVVLQTPPTFAAALMASKSYAGMSDDLHIPWKAFAVDLPQGLLDGSGIVFTRAMVGLFEGAEVPCTLILEGRREDGTYVQPLRAASDAHTLLFSNREDGEDDVEWLDPPEHVQDVDFKTRALKLACRLVVGLLYTMQHTSNFKDRGVRWPSKRGSKRGPPGHRVYFVGKPLATDVRPALGQYLHGRRHAPPSVQVLVRGHFKRQVIGIGRNGRRVIWIEPYWRGPEDAPILARPYQVGAA
jgi:hypothetical protein